MVRILALDLSKKRTGWALGGGAGKPLTRSIGFAGVHRGAAFASYFHWIRDRLLTNDPDLVAYERPIMGKNPSATTMALVGMAAITEAACSMKGALVVSVAPQTWRLAVLKDGYPKDPKAAQLQRCALLGWTPTNDDEGDACGVWAWAHLNHGDAAAMADQLSRADVRGMEPTQERSPDPKAEA